MPAFAYSFRDSQGVVRQGTSEAETPDVLKQRLEEQGFTVVEIKQVRTRPKFQFGRVGLKDLSLFCRQFSTMVDAGVSLVRCLDVLSSQTASGTLRKVLREIQAEVESGQSLSKSMAKYPAIFNNLFVGLIRAGEVGGVLEESLQRLASFLEADVELRRKVKSAMTYPVIVIVAALGIVTFLVTFILPKFFTLFQDLGIKEEEFPAMTSALMNISNFMIERWYFATLGAIVFVIAFKAIISTKFGRRTFDLIKLKAPVFGPLNHRVAIARFARTLGTLLSSGVPILGALETVAGTVSNEMISEAIMEARARIREGDRIGPPLEKSGLFPPMVVHMVSIGEESGALDSMLEKVAEFYESEVDAALASLTSAIEPLLIVFLGGMVGFIVVAVMLPITSVVSNLSGGSGDE